MEHLKSRVERLMRSLPLASRPASAAERERLRSQGVRFRDIPEDARSLRVFLGINVPDDDKGDASWNA